MNISKSKVKQVCDDLSSLVVNQIPENWKTNLNELKIIASVIGVDPSTKAKLFELIHCTEEIGDIIEAKKFHDETSVWGWDYEEVLFDSLELLELL